MGLKLIDTSILRRKIEVVINRMLRPHPKASYFLFGPRQTGKSTFLQATYPAKETLAFNLLETTDYLRILADPSLLREAVQSRPPEIKYVLIDEIQRVPLLLNEVHLLLESPRPPLFIMTGSSARRLRRGDTNWLGGRAVTYHMFPFVSDELGQLFSLNKALQVGTLPAMYLQDDIVLVQQKFRSYVDTYLREEIEKEARIRNLGAFVRFINIAAEENGRELNYSKMGRDCGISYQTIKDYFQLLEDTLLGFFLYPLTKTTRKRMAKHPKFYFFDTGVLRALQNKISVPLQPKTIEYGHAFEHFLILEIYRKAKTFQADFVFGYYRNERDVEVDLTIQCPSGALLAIEIKSTAFPAKNDLYGLKTFKQDHPKAKLCLACTSSRSSLVDDIPILPWQNLWDWILESAAKP